MSKKKKPKIKPVGGEGPDFCLRCGQKCTHDEDSRLCEDCQWDDADFVDSTFETD